jgi:hypothetical protein
MNTEFLFLDDVRVPMDAYEYTGQNMFLETEWKIVRNYQEFVKYIETNGVPFFISFDHDLAYEHYTPEEYHTDYDASKKYQDSQNYTEKTGYDCAKWLAYHCLDNEIPMPNYYCHSMNPVGKDNIISIFETFKKIKH